MSLILTRTQNMRENSPNLYKWEVKESQLGAFAFFDQDTKTVGGVLKKDLQRLAIESIGSTLQTPVLKYNSGISISSTRSATISDVLNTSAMVNFTFVTYSWAWTQVPSNHKNNEIKMQEDFEWNYKMHTDLLGRTIDTACLAALSNAKTQKFGNTLGYTVAANVLTAPNAKRKRIMADIAPIMHANDCYAPLHLITNAGGESLALEIMEEGLYNQTNKKIQLANKTLHFSNRLTDADGMEATFYAVNEGSCGLLYRFEREALYQPNTKTSHRWGIDRVIGLDIPCSTYYYEGVTDESATYGAATADNTRAWKQHYGFSIDICYVTAYNSDPANIASPIIKGQIQAV